MVALPKSQTGVRLDTRALDDDVVRLADGHEGVAEAAALVDEDAVWQASVDGGPTLQDRHPDRLRRDIGNEAGGAEVRALVDDVQHRVAVKIHHVDDDPFVEPGAARAEADPESERSGLDALACLTLARDLLQRLQRPRRQIIGTPLLKNVEQFRGRWVEELVV